MNEKTQEEIQAEAAAAAAAADDKAEAKRLKDEQKAAEKAERDAKKAADKAAKEQAKREAAEKKEADKQAALAKKEAEKKAAEEAKLAQKMPEQNGVRRPKPETLCGKAWAIFDGVSAQHGRPATIGESMEIAKAQGLNEGNVRAEYARWRKFFGISGRLPTPGAAASAE